MGSPQELQTGAHQDKEEMNGTPQDKEEKFNPGGGVSMRQQRSVTVLVPRSTVHIHCDPWRTLGVY